MAKQRGSPKRAAVPRINQNKIHKKVNPQSLNFRKDQNKKFPMKNFQELRSEVRNEFHFKNKKKNVQ